MECPLCLESYSTVDGDAGRLPRILKECAHTFCSSCLSDMLARSDQAAVVCPLCRARTALSRADVSEIRPNYALAEQLASRTGAPPPPPTVRISTDELTSLRGGGSVVVSNVGDALGQSGSLAAVVAACRAPDVGIDISAEVAAATVCATTDSGVSIACVPSALFAHLPHFNAATFPFRALWIVRLPADYSLAVMRSVYELLSSIFELLVYEGDGRVLSVLLGVYADVRPIDCLEEVVSLQRGYCAAVRLSPSRYVPLTQFDVVVRDADVADRLRARLQPVARTAPSSPLAEYTAAISACAAGTAASATLQRLLIDLRNACSWGDAWPVCGRGRAIAECLVRILDHSNNNPSAALVQQLSARGLIAPDLVDSYVTLCRLGNAALHTDGPGVSTADAVASVRAVLRILASVEHVAVIARELNSDAPASAHNHQHYSPVHHLDWTCSCGFVNFAARTACRSCSAAKSDASSSAATTTITSAPRGNNDWTCSCGFVNFASRTVCMQCSGARPATLPPVAAGRDDWTCPCGLLNFAFRTVCCACGNAKGSLRERPADVELIWNCRNCRFPNYMRAECLECQTPRSPSTAAPAAAAKPGDWSCPHCATSNFASRTDCFGCHRPKTASPLPAAASSPSAKPGDWSCPHCGKLNFASRTDCFGCHRAKSSAAASSTTASSPSAKPGDWSCSACGTSNFASRTDCFSCQRAKSSASAPPAAASLLPGQKPGDWSCLNCGKSNFASRSDCFTCRRPKPPPPSSSPSVAKPGDWTCTYCGKSNFASRTECYSCPRLKSGALSPSGSSKPGDWSCLKCGKSNFATRRDCFSCHRPKPPPPSSSPSAAAKPGDWTCPSCRGLNFASRTDCFSCRQRRP